MIMRICDDLRQAVLQAAIQGKLTKQLPEDGNANEQINKIFAAKEAYLWEKGKKKVVLKPITEKDLSFDFPKNWSVIRLGRVVSILGRIGFRGFTKSDFTDKTGAISLSPGNLLPSNKMTFEACSYIKWEKYNESPEIKIQNGDLLLVKTGSSYGKCAIVEYLPKESTINPQLARIVSHGVNISFLRIVFSSPFAKSQFESFVTGTATPTFSQEKIANFVLPFPPIEEQHRIVARVDELMARIDDLEKTESELEKLKAAFPGDMKAALLQAAMQGKLTEQLPEDGDAADLINQIAKEKNQLIKEGKIKKEKPLSEITPEEVPFDIPENWKWVRLGSIIYNRGQKTPDNDFTYIDISSIDNKTNRLGNLTNILSPNQAPSRARKIVQNGDIIYATVRPYLHNTCIIERDILPEPIVSTGFAVLSVTKGIYNRYLFRCLLSPMFDEYANSNENAKGVAYPAINDAKLMAAYIPLPPLAEQKRIVEKLDKLLPLCDGLVEE